MAGRSSDPFFHYKLFQHKEIMESGLLRLGKDVIPPFSGEGDVFGWIKKVKLVAKLQKVQDLASFIPLEDKDFEANFDGEKWTLKWKWKGEPPVLQNRVKFYKNSLESKKNSEFEEEAERWIVDGILVPWKGKGNGVLPLMAVFQATKKKVMRYNRHVR